MPVMRKPKNIITGGDLSMQSPLDMVGPLAMVGGLPEGLNGEAIKHMLKALGMDFLEEAPTALKSGLDSLKGKLGGLFDEAGRSLGGGAFSPAVGQSGLNEFAPVAGVAADGPLELMKKAKDFALRSK